jgi:hypothetical protein
MRKLRTFLFGLFYIPFGAFAIIHPAVIALIATAVISIGTSIYRSFVPVDMAGTLRFFESCWSCGMFSDIIRGLSLSIPKIYSTIGDNVVPIAAGLTFVWFAWTILSDYIKIKNETNPWELTRKFGVHLIKLTFVAALLMFPLPRFMMDTFLGPIMTVGLSYNHTAKNYLAPDNGEFSACMIATAVSDKADAGAEAFDPKLRHNMACQLANFHRMTGLGMTVGWTFAQMAFSGRYMYKFGPLPILPNILLLLSGIMITVIFLLALFPVPIYFFKAFVRLSLDLIMLPLMLLGWLFADWKNIFPTGSGSIKEVVESTFKDAFGITLVGLLTGLAVLLLRDLTGTAANGTNALIAALDEANKGSGTVDLMDALIKKNGSMINLIFAGIFIMMLMNAIPKRVERLFKSAKLPDTEPMRKAIGTVVKNFVKDIRAVTATAATGKTQGTDKPDAAKTAAS